MRWSVRSQLVLPVLLLLVGVAAISLTTAITAARQARRQLDDRLHAVARFLVEESQFPLTSEVLRQLRQLSGAEYLLVTSGGMRRTSFPSDPGDQLRVEAVAEEWSALQQTTPVQLGTAWYTCGAIRLRRGSNAGDTLYIFYPDSLWRDARWQAIRPSLYLGGGVGLASLVLAVIQAQQLSRRLQAVERRTRVIAGGDFGPMPLPARNDELRDLARSINEMAAHLAQLEKTVAQTERLRLLGQVSGGLAHQLRNGLTGARLAVQLFVHEAAPGADLSALEVALRQLTLLETHVKRFLDLGRAGVPRTEVCDVARLLDEAIELLTPQCRHAGIELIREGPPSGSRLRGDAGQLGQLLVNVLSNAIEAAGPGGRVESVLKQEDHWIVVEVIDSGSGPPPEVAERLFEPFVTSKSEGVGLGLAMARQIVEGHGGKIRWERRAGRTCFRIELPAE